MPENMNLADTADIQSHLPKIEQFGSGDHIAFLYSSDDDYRSTLTRLILHSLDIGMKVHYITQKQKKTDVIDWFEKGGVDCSRKGIRDGILMLSNSDPLIHRAFMDISHAVNFLEEKLRCALDEGWHGICIIRDISMVRRQKGIEMLRSDLTGFERLLGTGKVMLICSYRVEDFLPDVIQDVIRTHPCLIVGSEPLINIFHIQTSDARVYSLASLELQHWIAAMKNLTHRKAELEAALELYHDILEHASDLIQSVGPDGSFLYVNRAWKDTLGYTDEEVEDLNLFDIIHPESMDHCRRIFQDVMEGKDAGLIEATFVSKSGDQIPIQGRVNTHFIDGKPHYTRAIYRVVR
jgi:PAS domain S-box-containing protein